MTLKYETEFNPREIQVKNVLELKLILKMDLLLDSKKQFTLSLIDCGDLNRYKTLVRYEDDSILDSKMDKYKNLTVSTSLLGKLLRNVQSESLPNNISTNLQSSIGNRDFNSYLIQQFICSIDFYIRKIEREIELFYEVIEHDRIDTDRSNNYKKN